MKLSTITALKKNDELVRHCGGKTSTVYISDINEATGLVTICFENGNERTLSFAYLLASEWETVQ